MDQITLAICVQGIAGIGCGVGYASGPVIGGFLYKVLNEIVVIFVEHLLGEF